jgi:adenylylsulfate kinase-like enzyme
MVYLITGKAGAGKTTYAYRLAEELREEGRRVHVIDGDEWRVTTNNPEFSDEGRERNLIAAAEEAGRREALGEIVIMAFVAPKKIWRRTMRLYWKNSKLIYIPGGSLWEGTTYEVPDIEEYCEDI